MERTTPSFCGRCGAPAGTCEARCEQRHAFDPDRFCTLCGHRLDVQVYPDRTESSCKVCRVRERLRRSASR
ncbi:hypothetical protein [Euzebya tangerina]|uniref:biotin synthase auxiliary protein BsaP n=1 Tax=Euzebya tangerina TaxID=591198 RepID=UPI000E3178C3|nr:hypothetical protein [Euzebya tangerina]